MGLPGAINRTYYYVSMKYGNNTTAPQFGNLVWAPEYSIFGVESPYYYALYSIEHFLGILNAALTSTFTEL